MDQFKRIALLCKPYRLRFIIGFTLVAAIILLALVIPLYTQTLVDDVIKGGDLSILGYVLGMIAGLSCLRAALIFCRVMLFEDTSQKVIRNLRQDMYVHLHELSNSFFGSHSIGEIMSRMTQDMEAIRNLIAGGVVQIMENILYFVGSFIFIAIKSWQLALILLAVTPFVAIVGMRFDKHVRPLHREMRDQNAVLNSRAQENISGIRVVKAYAREDHEIDSFNSQNHKHLDIGIRLTKTVGKYNPLLNFLGSMPQVILVLAGGYLAYKNLLTTGAVVAVMGYLWMIVNPMRMLGDIINMVSQTAASTGRLFYYVDIGADIKDKANPYTPKDGAFKGHVQFCDVSFNYGDEKVLEHIDIDVPAGNTIAIMGATGTGKTSVVNLLSRVNDVSSGSVLIDGVNVKDYSLHALRRHIGYVMQEPFLFSQSIRNNIAFGNIDIDDAEIMEAAKASCTDEFASTMQDGYDTIVGERGMGLSGGQKQRIAIARAICYKPDILVLDDATSAVDMETELAIQNGLKRSLKGKTTFIVSHRISAVKDADEIILLSDHHIAERGTHEELIEKRGLYYGIFMDQYRDFEAIREKEAHS